MNDALGGVRTAARRWRVLLGLAATTAAGALVLSVIMGDVITQFQALRAARQLRAHHAVAFTVYYPSNPDPVSDVPDATVEGFATAVSAGTAFTVLESSVGVDSATGTTGDGTPVVAVIGDAAALAGSGGVLPCSPAPCAVRGADLADRDVGTVTVAGPGASVYVPAGGPQDLDGVVTVVLPASVLPDLGPTEREEAMVRSVWLSPGAGALDGFLAGCRSGRLLLVPADLATDSLADVRDQLVTAAMYVVGTIAFLALLVAALAGVTGEVLRAEERAWVIRRSCGARPHHLAVRVGTFTATVLLALPLPPLLLVTAVITPYRTSATIVLAALVTTTLALWARGTRTVLHGEALR